MQVCSVVGEEMLLKGGLIGRYKEMKHMSLHLLIGRGDYYENP